MSLDVLYPTAPQAIDMREPEKPAKTAFKVSLPKMEGVKPMNLTKFEILKHACILYLLIAGAWHTGWNVYCLVKPDATVFKNLKGMPSTDRAYMENYLEACGMGNWFENKENKCSVAGAALATLIKGQPVIADIPKDSLAGSDERRGWEQQAQASEIPSGNAKSPTEY